MRANVFILYNSDPSAQRSVQERVRQCARASKSGGNHMNPCKSLLVKSGLYLVTEVATFNIFDAV